LAATNAISAYIAVLSDHADDERLVISGISPGYRASINPGLPHNIRTHLSSVETVKSAASDTDSYKLEALIYRLYFASSAANKTETDR